MRYRNTSDRTISMYAALLIITIFGASTTMLIVRVASSISFDETTLAQVLDK